MPTSASKDRTAHGYPRPQLVREHWKSLNGPWQFALDPQAEWSRPEQVNWTTTIVVPFSPETAASGVGNTGFYRACWYRRKCDYAPLGAGHRLIIHFGAVDYAASVWVNGIALGGHEGGYTPFSFDITDLVHDGSFDVCVRAFDDPADLAQPRGKQDWELEPHSIWYTRTTGIWQTVWLEQLPPTHIASLRFTPRLADWAIALDLRVAGKPRDRLRLGVKLLVGEQILADDNYRVEGGEIHRVIALSDPGIDDYRNKLLWRPSKPQLIDVELKLWGERGELIDSVASYTAIRAVALQGDRFLLNGRPYQLRLVLDQGYWPESGLTPPSDEALQRDVTLAKAMGFNGVRKHQKIEDPRYLYWADVMGLLVWEEMPSAYRYTRDSIRRVVREWNEVMARDSGHPCIVAWVPFNESWGVPNLPESVAQRHYVHALYHLTKTLDSERPVVGNDGWESVATDIVGIHDYDADPERIRRRYHADEVLPRLYRQERPGGRLLVLEAHQEHTTKPVVLTEFGGIALADASNATWGYSQCRTSQDLAAAYGKLMKAIHSSGLFAGFCYTQFADTYQEANGLLYADRTPKVPLERLAPLTRGSSPASLQTIAPPPPVEEDDT